MASVQELDPELFTWELYDAAGPWQLNDALAMPETIFGYCDASRLAVRPRAEGFALMVEWYNGVKFWFHVDAKLLNSIKRRVEGKVGNANAEAK